MQKILQAIINFFRSIFGLNSTPEVSYLPPIVENLPEKPKAPAEISVLPTTPVTESPEPPVTPKPPIKQTPPPPAKEIPKPIVTEVPKTLVTEAVSPASEVKAPALNANELIIKLERYSLGQEDTLGRIMIEGKLCCYTLEDAKKDANVKGETCIPTGKYEITLRTAGAMNDTYARRFAAMHKGMLWLRNIPKFEYIFIHIGNTNADTKGCILVGSKPINETNTQTRRSIEGSSAAYQTIYPIIAEHISKGGKAFIVIENV